MWDVTSRATQNKLKFTSSGSANFLSLHLNCFSRRKTSLMTSKKIAPLLNQWEEKFLSQGFEKKNLFCVRGIFLALRLYSDIIFVFSASKLLLMYANVGAFVRSKTRFLTWPTTTHIKRWTYEKKFNSRPEVFQFSPKKIFYCV